MVKVYVKGGGHVVYATANGITVTPAGHLLVTGPTELGTGTIAFFPLDQIHWSECVEGEMVPLPRRDRR
jgi:hypothetical protein